MLVYLLVRRDLIYYSTFTESKTLFFTILDELRLIYLIVSNNSRHGLVSLACFISLNWIVIFYVINLLQSIFFIIASFMLFFPHQLIEQYKIMIVFGSFLFALQYTETYHRSVFGAVPFQCEWEFIWFINANKWISCGLGFPVLSLYWDNFSMPMGQLNVWAVQKIA